VVPGGSVNTKEGDWSGPKWKIQLQVTPTIPALIKKTLADSPVADDAWDRAWRALTRSTRQQRQHGCIENRVTCGR
jgi:hypothetical protein